MSLLTAALGVDGIAGAVTELEKGVSGVLMKVIPDADKRIEAQTEITRLTLASQTAQMTAMQQVMATDAASDSKYTKNARPTVVYWSLAVVTLIAALGVFGKADPVIAALAQVPQGLWDLIKYGVGIFTAGRTIEKTAAPVANAIVNAIAKRVAPVTDRQQG